MSTGQVRVRWVEGSISLGIAGKHSVVIDRAESLGGTETSFKASELLLLSLGGCLSSTLIGATKARNLTLEKVDIQLKGHTVPNPDRIGEIEVEVKLVATGSDGIPLDDEALDRLLEVADRGCFITNTLRTGIHITIKRVSEAIALLS